MTHPTLARIPGGNPRDRLKALHTIATNLQAKGVDALTDSELDLVPELKADIDRTGAKVAQLDRNAEALKGMGQPAERIDAGHSSALVEPRLVQAKAFRDAMATALEANPGSIRTKSGVLPASGSATRFDFSDALVASDRGPLVLADLVTRVPSLVPSGTLLVQSSRVNNAAAVPTGGLKPTSSYALTPRTWRVATIAHTIAIPRQYLADYDGLTDFIAAELAFGLSDAVDAAIALGTTDEENQPAPGLLSAATAIPATAFVSDALTSVRQAIGDLDRQGTATSAIALNSADWQTFELLRENGTTGAFLLPQAPSARAPRLLFGIPVVVSSRVPAGKAIVGDWSRASWIERQQVTIEAFESGMLQEASGTGSNAVPAQDLATRNMVRIRAELRGTPIVQTPSSFRIVSLAAS